MQLDNQVAIVTGSATGIGAAVAEKLASAGARVVVNCTKSLQDAEETIARIQAAGGDAILGQGDVSSDADCRSIAKVAQDKWGRIDMLVNNAGTTKFADHADLDALNADDFINIYKVNVIGAYQMIRACAPALKASGFGRIVNVSSIAGVLGVGSSVAYAASKGALNTMTKSLARSLAPEIRVNAVCPGYIGSGWFTKYQGTSVEDQTADAVAKSTPLKVASQPEDIAETILFFAGPESRHVTGEFIIVDAGMHLGYAPLKAR